MAPRGSTELFSETLVVYRTTSGAPQGSFVSPSGSNGRRPHRSARRWHSRDAAAELEDSQFKKEGGNQQTGRDIEKGLIVFVDLLNTLVDDSDLDNDLPNRINDFQVIVSFVFWNCLRFAHPAEAKQ